MAKMPYPYQTRQDRKYVGEMGGSEPNLSDRSEASRNHTHAGCMNLGSSQVIDVSERCDKVADPSLKEGVAFARPLVEDGREYASRGRKR